MATAFTGWLTWFGLATHISRVISNDASGGKSNPVDAGMTNQDPAGSTAPCVLTGNHHPTPDPWRVEVLILVTVAMLCLLWWRNHNVLSDFYDYSILTSAAGHLEAGLKPYRDFRTPLQSLPIYASYLAEKIWGARYTSLSKANLVVMLAYFFGVVWLLRSALSPGLRVLIAAALCGATFLQHGILWYNSLALAFLSLLTLGGARAFRANQLSVPGVGFVCLAALASSSTKVNFHLFGMTMVFCLLVVRWISWPEGRSRLALAGLALAVFGFAIGPIGEMLVNHASPGAFLQNVLEVAGARSGRLGHLFSSRLYLGQVAAYYPDDWSEGAYALVALVYAGCICILWLRQGSQSALAGIVHSKFFLPFCATALLGLILSGSLLLTATNVETHLLTAALVVVGLPTVLILFGARMSKSETTVFTAGAYFVAAYFLVTASAAAFFHSRLRYSEPPWFETVRLTHSARAGTPGGAWDVPLYAAEEISPRCADYFRGVKFTASARSRLKSLSAILERYNIGDRGDSVYWGPGLEILGRVYGGSFHRGLPLWWHKDTTVRDADAAAICEVLERAHYQWIFAAPRWTNEFPQAVAGYLDTRYERLGDREIVAYHRKP